MKRLFSALLIMAIVIFIFFFSPEQPRIPSFDKELQVSGARRALDMLSDIRAYPNKKLPDVGFFKAYEFSKRSLRKRGAGIQVQPWRAIGPHNIGGRTLAVALNPMNPTTIYAGSASGGLWRSYSGGSGANAWQKVPTGFPVLGVSSIAIAPNDSNTIHIGTGEVYGSPESFPGIVGDRTTRGSYGIGILKTSDGGQTWIKSLDWTLNQRRGVQALAIDPLDSNTIWAATTEGTYKSTDAGSERCRVPLPPARR